MILVDSSVWIDYFRGSITTQTEKLDRLLDSELLAIGDLILTEVLQGFHDERDFDLLFRIRRIFISNVDAWRTISPNKPLTTIFRHMSCPG